MLRIALVGFGNVGKAFARLIQGRSDMALCAIVNSHGAVILRPGETLLMDGTALDQQPGWQEGRGVPEILQQQTPDILVELSPTNLQTGEPALSNMKLALKQGIAVVTGNKGPIVNAYAELSRLAQDNHTFLGIGCTTGGALPSITVGTAGILGAELLGFEGVLNGTSNYILSRMEDCCRAGEPCSYETILQQAIEQGIAETHPEFDVEGYDTTVKMLILANLIYTPKGYPALKLADIHREGITHITTQQIAQAVGEGKRMKLVGSCSAQNGKLCVEVKPRLVSADDPLYAIHYKNKGVVWHTDTMGDVVVSGGASSPTGAAAAILRDILSFAK